MRRAHPQHGAAGERRGAGGRCRPALGRNAPLVPVDSAASRALVGVIAILTFLAALCAGAAELVGAASAHGNPRSRAR